MLENIKSTFVLKKLFSHLFDRVELNLVKYNKKLKMALNISLINYRIYNKIIFEEDIVYESMKVIQKEKFMNHIKED